MTEQEKQEKEKESPYWEKFKKAAHWTRNVKLTEEE